MRGFYTIPGPGTRACGAMTSPDDYTVPMTAAVARVPVTIDEYLALPAGHDFELVRGTLVQKAAPAGEHGSLALGIGASLVHEFGGGSRGGSGPRGWWLASDVDIRMGADVFRPDLAGCRRDRVPQRPAGMPVRDRPDWICEVTSPSNRSHDWELKRQAYAAAGVPHYWIAEPDTGSIHVLRLSPQGYVVAKMVTRGERARLEPFDTLELDIGVLFGDDPAPPESPPAAP